jgi:hypothetical protein
VDACWLQSGNKIEDGTGHQGTYDQEAFVACVLGVSVIYVQEAFATSNPEAFVTSTLEAFIASVQEEPTASAQITLLEEIGLDTVQMVATSKATIPSAVASEDEIVIFTLDTIFAPKAFEDDAKDLADSTCSIEGTPEVAYLPSKA